MWVMTCVMLGVGVVAVGAMSSVGALGSVPDDQLPPEPYLTHQDAPTPNYIPNSRVVGFHDNRDDPYDLPDTMTDTYSQIYNHPDLHSISEQREADGTQTQNRDYFQYDNQNDHHDYFNNAPQTENPDQNEIPDFENLDKNEIKVFENPDQNKIPDFENLDKNEITDSTHLLDLITDKENGNSTYESGRELYYAGDGYDRRRDYTVFRRVKNALRSLFGSDDRYGVDRQNLGVGDSSIGAAIIGIALITQVLTAAAFLSTCDEDNNCVTSCDNSELLCTAECLLVNQLLPCDPVTTCTQKDPVCTTLCSRKKRDVSSLLDVGIVQRAAESLSDSSFGNMFRSLSLKMPWTKETGRTFCNMARRFVY